MVSCSFTQTMQVFDRPPLSRAVGYVSKERGTWRGTRMLGETLDEGDSPGTSQMLKYFATPNSFFVSCEYRHFRKPAKHFFAAHIHSTSRQHQSQRDVSFCCSHPPHPPQCPYLRRTSAITTVQLVEHTTSPLVPLSLWMCMVSNGRDDGDSMEPLGRRLSELGVSGIVEIQW